MSDPRMPGTLWDPGLNAGYRRGRNDMRLVKVHKTAGTNSYNICKNNGLCQWLVPYEGAPWQFAEADSICFDSGPYNAFGPGIEIEAPVTGGLIRPGLSEFRELSPSQIEWSGKIFRWLHDEWGVPLELYDGPRFEGEGYVGFENHGDLDPDRSDGVTREEWDAMIGVAPPDEPDHKPEEEEAMYISPEGNPDNLWISNTVHRRRVEPLEWRKARELAAFFGQPDPPIWPLDDETFDSIPIAK